MHMYVQFKASLNLYAHNVLNAMMFICVVGPCRQTYSDGCNAQPSQKINVTVPNSVIIPCGNLLSSPNSTVDYCNCSNGVNEPLDTGVTTQYNLTPTEPSHHNNIIYCTNNQDIACYMLTVFCKELIILYPYSPCNHYSNIPLKLKITITIMQ